MHDHLSHDIDWVLVDPPARSTCIINCLIRVLAYSRTASRSIAAAMSLRMIVFATAYCAARYVGLGHAHAMQLAVFCLAR